MSGRALPSVFAIGLPHSGDHVLAELFKNNGFRWAHHKRGKLAQNIAYARASGTEPFIGWPDHTGFSGLFGSQKLFLPAFNLQDHVEFLLARFPDAYFIHTRRDTADWIAARFWADEGKHRSAAAWHSKRPETELPDQWIAESLEYGAFCQDLFAGNTRFLDINLSHEPIDKVIKHVDPDYFLPHASDLPDLSVSAHDIAAVVDYMDAAPTLSPAPPPNMSFAQQMTEYAVGNKGHSGPDKVLSGKAIIWGADGSIKNRLGADVALTRMNGIYHLRPKSSDFERAQATLNELIDHGAKPPLRIDMMDARFLGTPNQRNPPHRTVAYNRRKGAENLTLWPLPGYHTLAPSGQIGGFAIDHIPFEDKKDLCVWLGNMTGRMSDALTPEGRRKRGVYGIRDDVEMLNLSDADWAELIADLDCVPRYHIVKTYRDHPDFKVGLALRGSWKILSETRAFAGLHEPVRPPEWFHQYRYILSLSGNDTGSNFLPAAASNALILKEEDGWDLFYTDAFKPWVHYVPLAEGAQDVEEKLAWARANPVACKDMSMAATKVFNTLANPNTRAAILNAIVAQLNKQAARDT